MIIKYKKQYYGDIKIVNKFLLLPRYDEYKSETRWLMKSNCIYYISGDYDSAFNLYWRFYGFVDTDIEAYNKIRQLKFETARSNPQIDLGPFKDQGIFRNDTKET